MVHEEKYRGEKVVTRDNEIIILMMVPLIIAATEMTTKELQTNLEAIPAKHAVESLLTTAILGT